MEIEKIENNAVGYVSKAAVVDCDTLTGINHLHTTVNIAVPSLT